MSIRGGGDASWDRQGRCGQAKKQGGDMQVARQSGSQAGTLPSWEGGGQAGRQAGTINSVLKIFNKYIIMRQKTSGNIGGAIKRTNSYVILP